MLETYIKIVTTSLNRNPLPALGYVIPFRSVYHFVVSLSIGWARTQHSTFLGLCPAQLHWRPALQSIPFHIPSSLARWREFHIRCQWDQVSHLNWRYHPPSPTSFRSRLPRRRSDTILQAFAFFLCITLHLRSDPAIFAYWPILVGTGEERQM